MPLTDRHGIYYDKLSKRPNVGGLDLIDGKLFAFGQNNSSIIEVDLNIKAIAFSKINRRRYDCIPPSSNVYSIETANGATVNWYVNNILKATGDSVYLTFDTANRNYDIRAEIVSNNGKAILYNEVDKREGRTAPSATFTELEKSQFCIGDVEEVTLQVSDTLWIQDYLWSTDIPYNQNDSLSATLTFDKAGINKLSIIPDGKWCTGIPTHFEFEVYPEPKDIVTISGVDITCEEVQEYFVDEDYNSQMEWKINDIPLPDTFRSISYLWDYEDGKNQTLAVRAFNYCGTSPEAKINIMVMESPDAIISKKSDSLTTNEGSRYEWYLYEESISEDRSVFIDATGEYYVKITGENGCTSVSDIYKLSSLVALDEHLIKGISVFPNPASQSITIETSKVLFLTLIDVQGIIQHEELLEVGLNHINIGHLKPGNYLLRFQGNDLYFHHKIILH